MIDFRLTEQQKDLQVKARSFAQNILAGAPAVYAQYADQASRFRSTRPLYRAAVAAGLVRGQIPATLGGTSGSLVDAAIVVEELYAVEPGASLTILGTGLGLTPLILAGSREQQDRLLSPFLSGEGEPLASLVHSEPGGTANWLEKGADGLQTTAREAGGEWVINGEKLWTTNSGGWDGRGADLQCVVCRLLGDPTAPPDVEAEPASLILILMVTREDIAANAPGSYEVLENPELAGHTAASGPHSRFYEFRVPSKNLLAPPGKGAQVVEMTFGSSAAIVGAMSVGIMRAAFEASLGFARSDCRGGTVPIIQRQSVADLLVRVKTRTETARLLTWKALHAIENGPGHWLSRLELALEAKIFASDAAVESVVDAMKAVGMSSYVKGRPFAQMLNDAICLPLFDGGNVGVRQRQVQKIFEMETYEPWAATFGH
ncbi:putative acyl-CoA dehydrogenase [Pleurostoma richardsiae]|uniref:Acyl-CoA dehydrogenase n=1 Tax=Pleurostoma richardsiae TaxID=41990 RepID=A0AA38R6K7_9PEZI|nr:putative acyl-CoA dehydrogenase [Pleurostoma richardsiae]